MQNFEVIKAINFNEARMMFFRFIAQECAGKHEMEIYNIFSTYFLDFHFSHRIDHGHLDSVRDKDSFIKHQEMIIAANMGKTLLAQNKLMRFNVWPQIRDAVGVDFHLLVPNVTFEQVGLIDEGAAPGKPSS